MKEIKRLFALVLVVCLLAGNLSIMANAATTTKPSNGTTTSAPFAKGTGGSTSFRIPALTTLSDGTIVAAADARWNTTYDGGGLDTIVSTSTDGGSTWNYTFANYLGDNGNTYSGSGSTAFIDPALAVTADDTIYMLVDLYPYGVALNGSGNTAPVTTKGFDSNGRLLLSGNNHSSYGYYLENGKIYTSSGSVVSGYTVDAYFNITGTDGTSTNLFFSDSPYKVVRTGFLYLTKSTDGGQTWSEPTLLNLKTTSEMVCLVAPGRGLVTESGTIVFPVYSYHGDNSPSSNTQRMSFIYSTDGVNWQRTSEFNYNWASESAVVELSDGTLRFFFRNGTTNLCYVDYNMSSSSWGSAVNTGIDTNSNCQISAITYSKTSDGKQVILVSCPTGPNEAGSNQSGASYRLNGKIFVGLVNEDKTMDWQNSISVTSNNSQFMYSCLTELSDGSVAILYENCENAWGAGTNCYYTMDYKTYSADALGLSFDAAHTYEAVVTDATCTEDGYTTYTCTICGDSYVSDVVSALGHTYKTVTVAATCEAAGSVTTTCSTCGETTVEVIAALGHDYTSVTVDATCTTDGCTTHTCSICGDSYTTDHAAALGHNYAVKTVEATCETAGYTVYTCAACGDSYTADHTAALGHNYQVKTVEATCETAGYTVYACAACGDSYTADHVAAFGHDYQTVTVNATCETAGSNTHTCTICGDSYAEQIAALGHSYETVTVEATCETAGSSTHTCTVCGDSYAEQIAALGHSYKTVTVEATCEADGSVTTTCVTCGNTSAEVIAALGHNYETVVVEATCDTDGSVSNACTHCGEGTVEVIEAYGHDYVSAVKDATCTEDGCTTYTCTTCGDSYTADQVAAFGHNYEAVTVDATCETAGCTTYTCTVCGGSYAEQIAALGHDYQTVTVAATCETAGSHTHTCTVCGDSYAEQIAALGHDYETTTVAATCEEPGYIITICANCNDTSTKVLASLGHNYETVTVDATCEADGHVTITCSVCGDSSTEVIAALGHDYTSVTVDATCTTDGYTTHTCGNCGDSYTTDYTSAHGHNYTSTETDNAIVYTCSYCGDSYSESIAVEYSYSSVSSIASGKNYVITMYYNRQYYAVTHANNTISVTKITVSNGQITSDVTEDMLWTYNSGKLSYDSNGTTYYLYAGSSSSSNGGFGGGFGGGWNPGNSSSSLSVSTSNYSSVSFSSSRLKVGSYYLRYSNNNLSLDRSASTCYLFLQSEA